MKQKFLIDADEQILYTAKKNKFLIGLIIVLALLVLLSVVLLTIHRPDIKTFGDLIVYNYLMWPFVLFFLGIIVWWLYLSLNNFYITNKKIIFTDLNSVKYINFDDIKELRAVSNGIVIKTYDNKIFRATDISNCDEFLSQLKSVHTVNINPSYKRWVWLSVLLGVIIAQVCGYYLDKIPVSSYQIESKNYLKDIQTEIKSNWNAPAYNKNSKIITSFIVQADGTVKDIKIKQSSGNPELDNSAIIALKKSSPLPKLPKELSKNGFVQIEFTFDYNVFIR